MPKPTKRLEKVSRKKGTPIPKTSSKRNLMGTVIVPAAGELVGVIHIDGPNEFRIPYLEEQLMAKAKEGDRVQIHLTITPDTIPQPPQNLKFSKKVAPLGYAFQPVYTVLTTGHKRGRVSNLRPPNRPAGYVEVRCDDGSVYYVNDPTLATGDYVIITPISERNLGGVSFNEASLVTNCGTTPCP